MNLALDTLVDEVEPFLLRSELVTRTPRGRKLANRAYEHLGVTPPEEGWGVRDSGDDPLPLFD
jgi:Holliday junction DNA helicase RuvB